MNVNLELYKVFYYVAKTLSFSEASKTLFISQSAVSQSIKTLEKNLDTTLFFRNTKKVNLTNEGKLLLKHIEPAINLIQNGENNIKETHALMKGNLHIGASDTICKYILLPYFKKFHTLYPNIHIQVTNRTSIKCVDLLRQGSVDLIVTNIPNREINKNMEVHVFDEFEDIFIASKQYFPTLKNTILDFDELMTNPILMLEKNTTTSDFIYDIFKSYQVDIIPEIELGSIDLLVDLAKIGLGISQVPNYCLRNNEEELFQVNTRETLPKRELGIVTNKNVPLSRAAKKFISMF